MKKIVLLIISIICINISFGQTTNEGLKMTTDYSSENPEISDILQFEGIEYMKIKFLS